MNQTTLRKKRPLSDREAGLCQRLREIRQRLNLSQGEVAKQLDITREKLASYEDGRAPIKFEFALRFCWQLVISEQWMALGENEILARREKKFEVGKKKLGLAWYPSNARMCMSLLFDPVCYKIKPGMAFIEAYDKYFDPVYERLRTGELHPRILLSGTVNDALINNYFHALMEGWLEFRETAYEKFRFLNSLAHEADKIQIVLCEGNLTEFERENIMISGLNSGALTHEEADGGKKLEEFIRKETPNYLAKFNFPDAGEGDPLKKDLTDVPINGNNFDVKAKLPTLLKRLNEATHKRGMKTSLAKFMGVPLSKVSEWLSGVHEPSGETTLQLLQWVEQQEHQK